MSKPIHNPSGPSPATGFTLLELMVATALSLLLLGLSFTLVQQLDNTADIVGSMSDVNENLRAAVNMVSRDLSTAGENIPLGGIPVPYGGTAAAINRPGPPGAALTFPATGFIPVITPGYQNGPTQGSGANAITTDIVTIIAVDQTSPFNPTAVAGSPTVSSSQAQITVSAAAAANVQPGQLIMLTNPNASCLLAVSAVNTTTGVITFTKGDANDVLGVNQFSGPTSGTINQLETVGPPASWPAITAYPITMVTYYLDTSTPRKLQKLVTTGAASTAQAVALGINVMQFTYCLLPVVPPVAPTRNPASPNTIRKVVLRMIGETDHQNHASGQWYTKSITNAVTVQNLDFYNKYSLGASMTQN